MANQNPPYWCSHAVATARGWEDPVTGEVFVCDRSLDLSKPKPKPKVKKSTKKIED
jgi:hypothetical protein